MGFFDMITGIIFSLLVLIAAFGIGLYIIEQATQEQVGVEEVNCFDKYSNKIEDVKCEEKIMCGKISNLFKLEGCGK